jgi:hypothetical protein
MAPEKQKSNERAPPMVRSWRSSESLGATLASRKTERVGGEDTRCGARTRRGGTLPARAYARKVSGFYGDLRRRKAEPLMLSRSGEPAIARAASAIWNTP